VNYVSLTHEEYKVMAKDIAVFFSRPGKQYRSKTVTSQAVFFHCWSQRTVNELVQFLQERFEF
jgi:hypothetical protein